MTLRITRATAGLLGQEHKRLALLGKRHVYY